MVNGGKKLSYEAGEKVDESYVVFMMGERRGWEDMGILGYEGNRRGKVGEEKNVGGLGG